MKKVPCILQKLSLFEKTLRLLSATTCCTGARARTETPGDRAIPATGATLSEVSLKKIQLACLVLLVFHPCVPLRGAWQGSQLKPVYQSGKWGYADRYGKIVIKPQFDAARPFADGLAQVGMLNEELPELEARPNIRWGYIDETGSIVVQLRYTVLRDFSENLAAAAILDTEMPERVGAGRSRRLNLKWGYVDRSGREVIAMQFLDAGDFAEGLAHVNTGGGVKSEEGSLCGPPSSYGYIDKTGAFVIKPQFTHAFRFQSGRARVTLGHIQYVGRCLCCGPRFIGRYGYIDRGGVFVADKLTDGDKLFETDLEVNR